MKMFESVVLAYDNGSWDLARPIQGALELFRLRVHPYFIVQRQNALDFLGGHIPESEYVILCTHGVGKESWKPDEKPENMQMGFVDVVHQVNGQWESDDFALTVANIPQIVHLPGRKIIALGCGNGREPLARAFLNTGCKCYIGAIAPPDQNPATLFAISFFYHLLLGDSDPQLACTDKEACERAAAFDTRSKCGTHLFRYYE